MKRIVAIGASSSSNSINKEFASYAANLVSLKKKVIELDLRQYEMPIYSEDLQNLSGIPKKAFDFKSEISNSDALVISLAEHNGSYTAAFKNIYDWISVIETDVWCSKPILLLSTSTGARGGKTVLDTAHSRFSRNYKFAGLTPTYSLNINSVATSSPSKIEFGSIPLSNLYFASVSIDKSLDVLLIEEGAK